MSNWNTINPFPNGVAKVIAGSNVSVSGTTAYPIITNTGVASLTAGSNITLSGSTGNITIAASGGGGVSSLTAGKNITLSGSTGNITISASGGGSSGECATGSFWYNASFSGRSATLSMPLPPAASQTLFNSICPITDPDDYISTLGYVIPPNAVLRTYYVGNLMFNTSNTTSNSQFYSDTSSFPVQLNSPYFSYTLTSL